MLLNWVIEKVENIKQKYKSTDPFLIAKKRGIIIQYADLGETFGFYFTDSRISIINLNSTLDEKLQRFVCAHELGHAVLHPDSNTSFLKANTYLSIDKIEVEANTFAVELLLPNESLYQFNGTEITIYDVAAAHGIPEEFVHLKNLSPPLINNFMETF